MIKYAQIPRDERSIQIPFVPMLQPILGDTYWYFVHNLMKHKATMRNPEASSICALPVRDCNLVFRLDRLSHQLRVQFRIQKGSYDLLVNDLHRVEAEIQSMRELLVGKWIKDVINQHDTWLLVVAVEINTENVASVKKRYSSKKQEIFGAKVRKQHCLNSIFDFLIILCYYHLIRPLRLQFPKLLFKTRYQLGLN